MPAPNVAEAMAAAKRMAEADPATIYRVTDGAGGLMLPDGSAVRFEAGPRLGIAPVVVEVPLQVVLEIVAGLLQSHAHEMRTARRPRPVVERPT